MQRDVAADADVGSVILSRAMDHGSDLIVMGIYGHSRLRELVLGGASRTVLARHDGSRAHGPLGTRPVDGPCAEVGNAAFARHLSCGLAAHPA